MPKSRAWFVVVVVVVVVFVLFFFFFLIFFEIHTPLWVGSVIFKLIEQLTLNPCTPAEDHLLSKMEECELET